MGGQVGETWPRGRRAGCPLPPDRRDQASVPLRQTDECGSHLLAVRGTVPQSRPAGTCSKKAVQEPWPPPAPAPPSARSVRPSVGIVAALRTADRHGPRGRASLAGGTRRLRQLWGSPGDVEDFPPQPSAGWRCEQRCHPLSRGQHGVPRLSHATSPPLATSAAGTMGSEPSGEARALSPAPWSSFRCAPAWGGGPPPPEATVTAASPGFVTQTQGQRRLDRWTPPDGPGLLELRWPPGRRAGSGRRRRCWMPGWAHTGPRLVTGASSPGLCVCEGKPGAMKTRGSASPGRTAR